MRIKQLLPYVGTAFVAGVAGVVIGSSAASATVETVAAPAPPPVTITETVEVPVPAPANAVPTEEEVQAAAPKVPREGTHLVGEEIEPGTYRGEPVGGSCYWKRMSSLSGSGAIIDNDFSKGQTIAKIEPSDVAFQSRGCSWELVK